MTRAFLEGRRSLMVAMENARTVDEDEEEDEELPPAPAPAPAFALAVAVALELELLELERELAVAAMEGCVEAHLLEAEGWWPFSADRKAVRKILAPSHELHRDCTGPATSTGAPAR